MMKSNESNTSNGNSSKAPPHSNDSSTTNGKTSAPDEHTADLVTAVQYGYYDRVTELINADPQLASTPVQDNITLLHWAAINNRIEIAQYLLNKGAKIDASGGALNSTPLHWAVRDGKLDMILFLLSNGAQPELMDGEGFACIHLASIFGHSAIVAYLIAKGQNIDLLDKAGMTPLMHAAHKAKGRDPTQLLIRLGASINYQNSDNKYTALHYAVVGNNAEAIRSLLDCSAKTNIRNADNEDVYELAAKSTQTRHLVFLMSQLTFSNADLPKIFQLNRPIRRFGTKLFPYLVLILIAFVLELSIWFVHKGVIILALFFVSYGYMMIFFDEHVDRNLPIAAAQASILCLYACYLYYFLPYVHVISIGFITLVIFTYLSWSNYYLAQKCDPGFIQVNREQLNRTIIQLVEKNSFDYETFCTWCLTRRPLRSKHCRLCRRCVSKFDHHCPWIDNCVGDKNLRYFTGFVFFTPICLGFYLHGAYLFFKNHCHIFSTESFFHIFHCAPSAVWFTALAILHIIWISGLCLTVLFQIAVGFTTNERINFWRYKYFRSPFSSPFSFGWMQNLVDLINRRVLWYLPTNIDWTRLYTMEDFSESIPLRLKRSNNSAVHLLNV
ncbi:hypothetical protein I4U23_024282 [Adineta vaga]|nr:hypothetical protein I4U23_024282 [Adineta vaga]